MLKRKRKKREMYSIITDTYNTHRHRFSRRRVCEVDFRSPIRISVTVRV